MNANLRRNGTNMISLIIPVYNEEENLPILISEIEMALAGFGASFEAIFVNDGSRDQSWPVLVQAAKNKPWVKVINFRKNFGQTAALAAGINHARGEIIIPLDADLQNDPQDIPLFISKMNEGYDVVSGWRKHRQDKMLSRKIPSWLANALISKITGIHLHDYGCTMKAYRREVIKDVKLYGEMHRFMPAYAAWFGAKTTEIIVNHRARKFGKTKYGISRTFKVVLDLLVVKFLSNYFTKPMHFFGKVGFYSLALSLCSGLLAVYLREWHHISFISTPLPLLTVFLGLLAIQFILLGLLAEMLTRIYYEGQDKPTYLVKEKINFDNNSEQ